MLGLPISGRLATLAIPAMLAFAALAAGPALAQQKPPSVETLMYHMTDDRDVTKARKAYESAVQAAMLYHECPEEYRVDEEKKARADKVLFDAGRALQNNFTAAHQRLTTKLPADATITAINDYIAKLQQKEALNIGTIIKTSKAGCAQPNLKRIDKFYEAKYAYELQQQAAAAAAEEKRLQEVPAANESQETESH